MTMSQLFLWFNFLFKGVPVDTLLSSSGGNGREDLDGMTYSALIAYLKEKVEATGTGTGSSHWRYVLMAHGMLLFLALPAPSTLCNGLQDARNIAYKTRQSIAGEFLNNLTSDLPALRLLSVLALLFLVPSSALKPLCSGISKVSGMHLTIQTQNNKKNNNECYSMESTISSAFKNPGFGKRIVKHLALDHNYAEGQTYQSSNLNDVGLTSLMPSTKREWPYTRTWDSNSGGEQFNYAYAKLFKSLVRECGSLVLQELRTPLEEAANAVEDRSQQCIAAEIISGLLRSDMPCVVEAWHSWLRPLLWKVLLHTTVESACEWAACVRLAVGGKGRSGRHVPVLRSCVLECIAEPLLPGSATSLVSKRLMLLQASLLELGSDTEMDFQIKLLGEVLEYMSHPAPQVQKKP
jgi:proteasome activator subunit 4